MKKRMRLILCTTMAAVLFFTSCAHMPVSSGETVSSDFISLAKGVPGILYRPAVPGENARIAVVAMHNRADFLQDWKEGPQSLADRGFTVLCANTSTSKSGFVADDDIDKMLLNVKAAVTYLKSYPGIEKVILWGYSGGGALMSAYQKIAENGVEVARGENKIIDCPDSLKDLPPADGLLLIDATIGESMTAFHLDPAVIQEDNGIRRDPDLDMYNPANGYDPEGSSYSEEFRTRFFNAQKARLENLVAAAEARWEVIQSGDGSYLDDEPFIIPGYGGDASKLYATDLSLCAHTRNAYDLIHPDGSVTKEIVHANRTVTKKPMETELYAKGAMKTSVHTFLSTMAIRPSMADERYGYDETGLIYGVDFNSNYENTVDSVENISKPMLVVGMTAGVFFLEETFYEHAKAEDKTLAYVDGATHIFLPVEEKYGDVAGSLNDYIARWLSQPGRF